MAVQLPVLCSRSARALLASLCLILPLLFLSFMQPPYFVGNHIRRDSSKYSDEYTVAADIWAEDVKCYAIPYGAVGFSNHIWTYYTITCLSLLRTPWWPWRKLQSSWADALLSSTQGIATFVLNIINIRRCRFSWQLVLVTVWKMTLSLGQSVTGILSTYAVVRDKNNLLTVNNSKLDVFLRIWVFMYIMGCIVGLVGLGNIEHQIGYLPGVILHHAKGSAAGAKCEAITAVFAVVSLTGLGPLMMTLIDGHSHPDSVFRCLSLPFSPYLGFLRYLRSTATGYSV